MSPSIQLEKISSRVLTETHSNKTGGARKQESLPTEPEAPVMLISSKKRRSQEDQATDDDYPFDSGLKCNIF